MTLEQINAIVSLLLAFYAPQSQVAQVQAILENSRATTTITIAPTTTSEAPIFGASLQTNQAPQTPVTPASKAEISVRVDKPKEGSDYAFVTSVFDDKGNYIKFAPISLTVDGKTENKETNNRSTPQLDDWRTTFAVSLKQGTTTLQFKSGNLTKEVEVVVE
jgi:hypothetical protein